METRNRLTAARGEEKGGNGGKKGKGTVKEHIRVTHAHGLWEQGAGRDGGGQKRKTWDNCNRIN